MKNDLALFPIYCGSKLMLLEIKKMNVRIIDGYNLVETPLSKLSKNFWKLEWTEKMSYHRARCNTT